MKVRREEQSLAFKYITLFLQKTIRCAQFFLLSAASRIMGGVVPPEELLPEWGGCSTMIEQVRYFCGADFFSDFEASVR